jgi:hypothetical protein
VPVGIEQHLVGLQRIGTQQKSPAVRQLDMYRPSGICTG